MTADGSETDATAPAPKDALAWLQERGVRRDPIRVAPDPRPSQDAHRAAPPAAAPATGPGQPGSDTADVRLREAATLAIEAPPHVIDLTAEAGTGGDAPPAQPTLSLDEQISKAYAIVRRSTANAPQSRGRLEGKLRDRGIPDVVIAGALDRAERAGLVDDAAMLTALVRERRERGHAPARIRRDLRKRGFDGPLLEAALAEHASEDPYEGAFAVAVRRASSLLALPPETATRRLVGYVARRGYPEGLARKVARDALYAAREEQAVAER